MSIGLRRAEERVRQILQRVADRDVPLYGIDPEVVDDEHLGALRDLAESRIARAGRSALIDEAFDRIAAAYASRLGDANREAAIFGVVVPTDARQLAASQVALQDLVLAAVAEDLLAPEEAETLAAAGEVLLRGGEELPFDWTPPADAAAATESDELTGESAGAWTRGELIGSALLVGLALVGAWVATGNVIAGFGLGLGVAAMLFLWRRERLTPNDVEP